MRRLLFADNEVFDNDDGMAMQAGAALDVSALLAAWCGSASDTGITSGADPQAVLAGLGVSAAGTTVTVAPGSLVFVIADTEGVSWQVAASRASSTLTVPLSAAGNHRVVVVEALVSVTTTNATREFKRELAGRVVIQDESTPKVKDAVVTFRARSGVEDVVANSVRLPAWDSLALPIAYLTVTDSTITVTDIRRMVQPNLRTTTFQHPVHARTGVGGVRNLAVSRNLVGFGAQTAMDYVPLTRIGNAFPSPPGSQIDVDSGYAPAVTNSVGYVYACRVSPKVGALHYVLSSKIPTLDRDMPTAAVTLPAPWPAATTAAGSECKYVCPMFYGTAQSTSTTQGVTHTIEGNRPRITVAGVATSTTSTLDYASVVPPNAMSAIVDIRIDFTVASPAPTYVNLQFGAGIAPFPTTLTAEEATMVLGTAAVTSLGYIFVRNVRVNFYHNMGGVKHDLFFEITGANTSPVNLTVFVNEVTEMLRQ